MCSKLRGPQRHLFNGEFGYPPEAYEENTDFSDLWVKSLRKVEQLNKLLSEDDEKFIRGGGDATSPRRNHREAEIPRYHARNNFHRAQDKMDYLLHENKILREMMCQATYYGNMQALQTEIEMLRADRNRLRDSLNKVVQIEGKILEYKHQAFMSRKHQAEAENLRKELNTLNEKFSNVISEYKHKIDELEAQTKDILKQRNEFRNKTELLQKQIEVLNAERQIIKGTSE